MARLEIGDRVRAAALDAGILPNNPIGPVIEAVADLPAEVELRIAPVLAEMRAATAAIEKAAAQPLLNGGQIKFELLPALLAAWTAWHVVAILVALAIGMGVSWYMFAPPLSTQCHDERGGRWCVYWVTPPTEAAPR